MSCFGQLHIDLSGNFPNLNLTSVAQLAVCRPIYGRIRSELIHRSCAVTVSSTTLASKGNNRFVVAVKSEKLQYIPKHPNCRVKNKRHAARLANGQFCKRVNINQVGISHKDRPRSVFGHFSQRLT